MTPYEPTFISNWITAKAQDDKKVEFFVPFPSDLHRSQPPVKVIVEVKVTDSGDSYIFNAFGSAPRDDDVNKKYGGVIYFYNATGVLILLPGKYEKDPDDSTSNGKAVYLGTSDCWYQPTSHDGDTIREEYVDAQVRVKMWLLEHMPPDYDSRFIHKLKSKDDSIYAAGTLDSNNRTSLQTYLEVPISISSLPAMVVIQAQPVSPFKDFPGLVSEGNGMPACMGCGKQAGGLAFAYNETHVRLWVKKDYPIISASDGWGDRHHPNPNRLVSSEVTVRVLAWSFDNAPASCRWMEKSSVTITESKNDAPRMLFRQRRNIDASLVVVSISPLDGINSDYVFYGAGSVVTSGDYQSNERYSGVVFGYNEHGVFVWRAKPSTRSTAFLITNPWGEGHQSPQSKTNDVRIDIQVFGLMARGACNATDLVLTNARLSVPAVEPCQKENITCTFGYELKNDKYSNVFCHLNAVWAARVPQCTQIFCPGEPDPSNGTVVHQNTTVNGEIYYSCHPGYNVSTGNLNRKCLSNGTWSGDPPICSEILCPQIIDHENGEIVQFADRLSSFNSVNATVSFSCLPGFAISGDVTLTCLITGSWSAAPPVCTEILCPNLTDPSNGVVDRMNNKVNGTVTYACNTNYYVTSGNLRRVCSINGHWSGDPPTCSEILCPEIPSLDNGIVTILPNPTASVHVNSNASFSCLPGFALSADVILTCLITGNWSAAPPVCSEIILCPNVTDPSNGTVAQINNEVNGTLLYTCNSYYHVTSGDLQRVCLNNGSWSGDPPVCSELLCPPIEDLENGVVKLFSESNSVNVTASFSCLPGFELSVNVTIICLISGNWSAAPPICSQILCPNVTDPLNGVVVHVNNNVNGTLTYTCNKNYHVTSGNLSRVCSINGFWSGDPPVCSETSCPLLTIPANADVSFSPDVSSTNSGGISIGTSASFTCKPGYRLNVSVFVIYCGKDGSWTGTPPGCEEILCPDPEIPPNSTLTSINKSVNGTAQFVCNKGYFHTNGSLQQTCLEPGVWNGTATVCTASGSCLCPCQYVQVPKYTDVNDEKLIKKIKEMQKELQVLKNKTSAALRKKISIKDFRPSTNVSGAVWMVLLLFLVAAIVVPDAINAFQNIVHYFHSRKHTCNKRLKKW
ncbi:CUB and sushi domain-containing protein 1-like [Crassostrea virginica]